MGMQLSSGSPSICTVYMATNGILSIRLLSSGLSPKLVRMPLDLASPELLVRSKHLAGEVSCVVGKIVIEADRRRQLCFSAD